MIKKGVKVNSKSEQLAKDFNLESGVGRLWGLSLGCDPEFFIKSTETGEVVGAERVIPECGLGDDWEGSVILDGFQAEINVKPDRCRELVADSLSYVFQELRDRLEETGDKFDASFEEVVTVKRDELDSLSDNARQFGCAPSLNASMKPDEVKITVNPAEYNVRSAGGHLHFGASEDHGEEAQENIEQLLKNKEEQIIKVLDVVVGNTCVLLDRNPMMAERRKVYGHASEYRIQPHGLEYRTLSNFWLKSYTLMSFTFNLARYAISIVNEGDDYVNALMSVVNFDDVIKAINENDFDLAMKNFDDFCIFFNATPLINNYLAYYDGDYVDHRGMEELSDYPSESCPFSPSSIKKFKFFVSKGMDYWFTENVIQHWAEQYSHEYAGWEEFSTSRLSDEYYTWKKLEELKLPEVIEFKAAEPLPLFASINLSGPTYAIYR